MNTMPESTLDSGFDAEVKAGRRFRFGNNWQRFLTALTEERITTAQESLQQMLGLPSLEGRSFLDIGCGSGLFSLAAMRLNATRMRSFDFDPQSVECAKELKARYFPGDDRWNISQGSALDANFLSTLGSWDIVYSWGVLHHTGDMRSALANISPLVAVNGRLFISIYNDVDRLSSRWAFIKALYNRSIVWRCIICMVFIPYSFLKGLISDLLHHRNPTLRYRNHNRGMSMFYDAIDWLGGYPYEVAKPEEIIHFYQQRGFRLLQLKTAGRYLGCNEFVFTKTDEGDKSLSSADNMNVADGPPTCNGDRRGKNCAV